MARVRLQLRVDAEPGVAAASFVPGDLRLHVAGTPHAAGWTGGPLDDGQWHPLESYGQPVDLVKLSAGGMVWAADAALPPGAYDYLLLEVSESDCHNVVEPTALALNVEPNQEVAIALTLYLKADWPQEGECSVLAKGAAAVP